MTTMDEYSRIRQATIGSTSASWAYDSNNMLSQIAATGVQQYDYSFNVNTGNLNSRGNFLKSKTESFGYDNLDRLTGVTGPQNLTMDYNANGNIATKSDVGSIFDYDHPTKPYALTGVETSSGLIPDETQIATYTSFEQVSTLDEGDYHAEFVYNSDNQRAKMLVTDLGSTILTRWYVGSRYIKETEGTTTKEYTWIGGDAYSAPVVAEKAGGTTTYYYLLRDYLGNITHKVNTSNTVVAEYSYDAWGRRRDKDDWSYTLSGEPDLLAGRSFTSHEYLPWFELVNMNGRLYDPVVGRFLSADPYVQMPDGTQSYNRYSYCLNNPLRYTDPSGYKISLKKFGKWIGKQIGNAVETVGQMAAWTLTLPASAIDAISNGDWSRLDPFHSGTISNNAYKITAGLFKGDILQIISRFTWELPQTILGYGASMTSNYLGNVRSVSYYGGATVTETYADNWGAITLGSFIIGSRGITADPDNPLFQHEYGHYLQSQASGWFYLSKYGIPSALSKRGVDHSLHPAEQDANARALRYFNKHISGYNGWNHFSNPIVGYNRNLPFNDSVNQAALDNARLRLSWYDYLMSPLNATIVGIPIPGLINALILNKQY